MGHKRKRKRSFKSQLNELTQPKKAQKDVGLPVESETTSSRGWGIKPYYVFLILLVAGAIVFFTGLATPFMGDDQLQIVNNPDVHSLAHIGRLFDGSTFYTGQEGNAKLTGTYYRPLMMVVYAVLYTLFGAHTVAFHILQVLLCIASAFLVYLIIEYFFSSLLALILAVLFLEHPLNSQIAFSIPAMQDALYFFFGMLAMWCLIRFRSVSGLVPTAISLFLSLLSKEAGLYFVAMAILYLAMFDRKRLGSFVGIMIVPLVLYAILDIHAVGFLQSSGLAPIDSTNLGGRLMTAPSIMEFYLTRFLVPWKLATGYYWVYPTFSIRHVLIPFLFDAAVASLVVYTALVVKRKATEKQFYAFVFFAVWAYLGLVCILQITPLDMTACENWFYFSMFGFIGMIAVLLTTFQARIKPSWFFTVCILLIVGLGVRTAIRGTNYSSTYTLASHDIAVSKQDYAAYSDLAEYEEDVAYNSVLANAYAQKSVAIHPYFSNYYNLAEAETGLNDYAAAVKSYQISLRYGQPVQTYENLAWLTMVYGNYTADRQLILTGINKYPQDASLWTYLAILEYRHGNLVVARADIKTAAKYGQVSQNIYQSILSDQSFKVTIDNAGDTITIKPGL